MKFNARIMSLILAMALVMTSFGTTVFAANFSDVDGSKSYASAVSLLSALKLLKGYEDGTFKPDGDITRAEFAAVIVRALGQEESAVSSAGTTQFTDVAADFWGSGYINVASTLGIINGFGDGNFGPGQNVTYEQAVKMTVCALGYEPVALSIVNNDASAVWPKGYLAAATQLNIISGVNGTEGVPAKRWQVARLVYNSLETDLMEKSIVNGEERYIKRVGRTLLTEKLDIEYSTGEFRANTMETASVSGMRARSGEVIIYDDQLSDEEVIKDGGLSTAGMIGHSIKYYYNENSEGVKTLIYIEDKTATSSILKIDAVNIEKIVADSDDLSDGAKLYYWENKETDSRAQVAEIVENPSVLVNGALVSDATVDDIVPLTGSIELIDSNRSGVFDKIHVTSYLTYVVKTVNTSDKLIIDQFRNTTEDNTIKIDEEDAQNIITIKRADGTAAAFSNISTWNVLSVKQSKSGSKNVIDVIISNKIITGTISEVIDEDNISVNNTQYEFSAYFKKYYLRNESSKKLNVDDSGKFYLDKDGRIAGYEKTASASSNYGYLVGTTLTSSKLRISILKQSTSSSTPVTDVITYDAASKIRIDGESKSKEDVLAKLEEIVDNPDYEINVDGNKKDGYASQLVRFTVNASNEVTAIQTIENADLELFDISYTSEDPEDPEEPKNVMEFNSNTNEFTGSGNSKFRINSSTQVFIVPYQREDLEGYSSKIFSTSNSYFKNGKNYIVEAYDVSGSVNTAKAVVVYDSGVVVIDETSPIAFITAISSTTTSGNSEYNGKITAYVYGAGQTSTSPVTIYSRYSDITDNNLKVGDVILYGLNAKGFVETIEPVLNVGGTMKLSDGSKGKSSDGGYNFEAYNGLIFAVDEDNGVYTVQISRKDKIEDITKEDRSINVSSSAVVMQYDASASASDQKFTVKDKTLFASVASFKNSDGTESDKADEVFLYVLKNGTSVQKIVLYVVKR